MLKVDELSRDQAQALIGALQWQQEAGVAESFGESPFNRYEEKPPVKFAHGKSAPALAPAPAPAQTTPAAQETNIRAVATPPSLPEVAAPEVATLMAQKCKTLEELKDAMVTFDHCTPKRGARNFIFAQGAPCARIMVISDAPDKQDDIAAAPFSGENGALLDAMFKAIGFSRGGETRETALYLTQLLPWHPPQGREPTQDEVAMMRPFLAAHIRLVAPDILVVMGRGANLAVLGRAGAHKEGGAVHQAFDCAVVATLHPRDLLRDPLQKRQSWQDLLRIKAYLESVDTGAKAGKSAEKKDDK